MAEKNVKVLFNTERKDTEKLIEENNKIFKKELNDKNFNVESFQVKTNPSMCSVKPYLIPLLGLNRLLRIDLVS